MTSSLIFANGFEDAEFDDPPAITGAGFWFWSEVVP